MRTIKLLFLLSIVSILGCSKDKTCPQGFEGDNCDEEKTPLLVIIKSITVTKFPQTAANGAGWDFDSGADLTFSIINKTVGGEYVHDKFIQNATVPAKFTDVNYNAGALARYIFRFYDYDLGRTNIIDADDLLGGAEGDIWTKGTKFPKTIPGKSGDLEFVLELEYTF